MKSENYNRSEEMQVDFLESDSISGNTHILAQELQERSRMHAIVASEVLRHGETACLFYNLSLH